MRHFPSGQNPRDYMTSHRERGFKKFTYTYMDLAVFFGTSVEAVRMAVSRGCFDPEDLSSIFSYASKRRIDAAQESCCSP